MQYVAWVLFLAGLAMVSSVAAWVLQAVSRPFWEGRDGEEDKGP